MLSYVPPLWRKIMDPKVLALVDGDLRRVNIVPAI
jgi:alkane 1-monooxygenase